MRYIQSIEEPLDYDIGSQRGTFARLYRYDLGLICKGMKCLISLKQFPVLIRGS